MSAEPAPPAAAAYPPRLDVEARRRDFPILATEARGKPLTYLDNAATSQKPQAVLAMRWSATTRRRTPTSTEACTS